VGEKGERKKIKVFRPCLFFFWGEEGGRKKGGKAFPGCIFCNLRAQGWGRGQGETRELLESLGGRGGEKEKKSQKVFHCIHLQLK